MTLKRCVQTALWSKVPWTRHTCNKTTLCSNTQLQMLAWRSVMCNPHQTSIYISQKLTPATILRHIDASSGTCIQLARARTRLCATGHLHGPSTHVAHHTAAFTVKNIHGTIRAFHRHTARPLQADGALTHHLGIVDWCSETCNWEGFHKPGICFLCDSTWKSMGRLHVDL